MWNWGKGNSFPKLKSCNKVGLLEYHSVKYRQLCKTLLSVWQFCQKHTYTSVWMRSTFQFGPHSFWGKPECKNKNLPPSAFAYSSRRNYWLRLYIQLERMTQTTRNPSDYFWQNDKLPRQVWKEQSDLKYTETRDSFSTRNNNTQ